MANGDLPQVQRQKELLVQLSREYEALRKANAGVDYQAWVISRLKDLTQAETPEAAEDDGLHLRVQPDEVQANAQQAHIQPEGAFIRSVHKKAGPQQPSPPPAQLEFSLPRQPDHRHIPAAPAARPSCGLLLSGEGCPPASVHSIGMHSPASAGPLPVPYREQPGGQPQPTINRPNSSSPSDATFISKLYQPQQGTVWPRPEAYFSTKPRPHQHSSGYNPGLETQRRARRGVGAAHCLQDATERERRLALSTALAKERVALGIQRLQPPRPPQQQHVEEEAEGAGRGGGGGSGVGVSAAERRWAAEAAQAEQGQVLHMAQQLLLKHDGLAAAMQATNEQVKQQQTLLQAALERLAPKPDAAPHPCPPLPANSTLHPAACPHNPGHACGSSSSSSSGSEGMPQPCPPLPGPVAGAWFVRAALPGVQQLPHMREQQDAGGMLLPVLERHLAPPPHCERRPPGHSDRRADKRQSHGQARKCDHRQHLKQVLKALLWGGGARGRRGGSGMKGVERGNKGGHRQQRLQQLISLLRARDRQGGAEAAAQDALQLQQQVAQEQVQARQGQQGLARDAAWAAQGLKERVRALKQQYQASRAPAGAGRHEGRGGDLALAQGDIEVQAQEALQRDTQAFQHQSRLDRIDELEDRLAGLMQRLEQQAQQQPLLQAAGQGAAGAMPGAMTPGLGLDLLPAQQQQQQRQQLTGQAGQEELGAAEVHLLMAQLQRMEEQENAMRQKWLGGSAQPGQSPPALSVYDGQVHTAGLVRAGEVGIGAGAAGAGAQHASGAPTALLPSQCEVPMQPLPEAPPAQAPPAQAVAGLRDTIDSACMESVMAGRRSFLLHQRLRDGDLVGTSDPGLNPVDVVEDVADMLLDELLGEQAQGLLGILDALGEDMFEDEFST